MMVDKLSTFYVNPVAPKTLNIEASDSNTALQHIGSPNFADCDSLLFSTDVNTACEFQQLTWHRPPQQHDFGATPTTTMNTEQLQGLLNCQDLFMKFNETDLAIKARYRLKL